SHAPHTHSYLHSFPTRRSSDLYLKYNTDVVLDFPHKDSLLEGGMTREDRGKKEIYYHNVIAKEEIDTLLAPKTLVNVVRYRNEQDRKSTRLNSSHVSISYAVFC